LEPGCALFPYPAGARSGFSPNCAVEWIWEFGVYHQILALYLRNIYNTLPKNNKNEKLGYYCVGVYLLAEFYVLKVFGRILILQKTRRIRSFKSITSVTGELTQQEIYYSTGATIFCA